MITQRVKNMKRVAGISLIEIAIVIIIVGFLVKGLIFQLLVRTEQHQMRVTQQSLKEIEEALLGFAVMAQRLPCPDSDEDGREDSVCDEEGDLPWADLGVGQQDAWGNPFRYRVLQDFTVPITSSSIKSELVVADKATYEQPTVSDNYWTVKNDSPLVAIIFSCGKNGRPEADNDADGTPNHEDSIPNNDTRCDNPGLSNEKYTYDTYSKTFDDILIWVSRNILFNRLNLSQQYTPSQWTE
jgi:type II secretory pathway pseudopilin PulG